MSRPHLRAVVDGETGELHANPCPRCIDVELQDLENAERRIRKLEREKRAMERDRDAERQTDPQRQVILGLIDAWKRHTGHPKANANAGDRFDVVKARLAEGYAPEDIELAIEGIGARPYVVEGQRVKHGSRGQRFDRLGIVCGGGEAVEKFAIIGYEERKAYNVRKENAPAAQNAPGPTPEGSGSDAS
jgi:hypothetical protein